MSQIPSLPMDSSVMTNTELDRQHSVSEDVLTNMGNMSLDAEESDKHKDFGDRLEASPQELIVEIFLLIPTKGYGIDLSQTSKISGLSCRLKAANSHPKVQAAANEALRVYTKIQPATLDLSTMNASELSFAYTTHLLNIQSLIVPEVPSFEQMKVIRKYKSGSFSNITGISLGRGDFYHKDQNQLHMWNLDMYHTRRDNTSTIRDRLDRLKTSFDLMTNSQGSVGAPDVHLCLTEQYTEGAGSFSLAPRDWTRLWRLQPKSLFFHGCRAYPYSTRLPFSANVHMILPKGFPICTSLKFTTEVTSPQDMYRAWAESAHSPPIFHYRAKTLTITDPNHVSVGMQRKIFQDLLKISRRVANVKPLSTNLIKAQMEKEITKAGSFALELRAGGEVRCVAAERCPCCGTVEGIRTDEELREIAAARAAVAEPTETVSGQERISDI